MQRRTLLPALAAALAAPRLLHAQADYPNRPPRIIIPWPPGQATDLVGRLAGQILTEQLGRPVVAENRAGAGGMIGTDAVAKAAPDGYTILAASSGPVTINPLLQPRVPYDAEKELAPVAMLGNSPYQLVVKPDFPARDAKALIARVKAEPGKYTFASSGTGATAHLICEAFNRRAGLDVTHVPFPGSSPSLTAVIAGQVDYSIETLAATNPLVRAGSLRSLGISTARGSALAPGVPPIAEAADMPGFDAGAWVGIMVPAGTPAPIVERLATAFERGMAAPDIREKFANINVEVDYRAAAPFAAHLRNQKEAFAAIIRSANIRLE